MIFKPLSARWRFLIGVLSIVLLLGGYTWLSNHRQEIAKEKTGSPDAKDKTVPTWSMLARGLVVIWDPYQGREDTYSEKMKEQMKKNNTTKRWIVVDALATTWRFAAGMFFGITIAFVLGVMMGCFHTVDAFLNPSITFLSNIPPAALMALFFAYMGFDTSLYVSIICFSVVPTLAQCVSMTIKEFPEQLIVKAKTLGASTAEIIWNVIIPSVMPKLLDQARMQISMIIVTLLFAEMSVGAYGIGYRINTQRKMFEMNVVFLYIAFAGIAMFTLNHLFRFAQAKLYPWYVKNGE